MKSLKHFIFNKLISKLGKDNLYIEYREYLNSTNTDFFNKNCLYTNHFYQYYFARDYLLVDFLKINKLYINDFLLKILLIRENFIIKKVSYIIMKFILFALFPLSILISFISIIIKQIFLKNKIKNDNFFNSQNKEISIVFCKTSLKKISNSDFRKNIIFVSPNIKDINIPKTNNIFYLNKLFKLRTIINQFFKINTFNFIKDQFKGMNIIFYNSFLEFEFLVYFLIRFPNDIYIHILLQLLVDKLRPKCVLSGVINERHALNMNSVLTNKIKKISLPHGIATSIKLPINIFGEKYFCNSKTEFTYLNKYYPSIKFFYKEPKLKSIKDHKNKEVLFCTSARSVKSDQNVINLLGFLKINFNLRLHPNDNIKNYKLPHNCIHEKYNDNPFFERIIVSRCSNVLNDAIRNNSLPVAVLLNSIDRYELLVESLGVMPHNVVIINQPKKLIKFFENL